MVLDEVWCSPDDDFLESVEIVLHSTRILWLVPSGTDMRVSILILPSFFTHFSLSFIHVVGAGEPHCPLGDGGNMVF